MPETTNNPVNSPSFEPQELSPSTAVVPTSPLTTQSQIIYSDEEKDDPTLIRVSISDVDTPLVILFGPPSCGKTMTMVRLARYLKGLDYTIIPDRAFRPSHDENHTIMCEAFNNNINSDKAADSTKAMNFMLIKVLKNGKPVCQILEAPGEHYFKPGNPRKAFLPYIHAIINSPNRRIWAVMLEPHQTNLDMEGQKANYVDQIKYLKTLTRKQDNFMFIYNKADESGCTLALGVDQDRELARIAKNDYQNIFVPFINQNPITSLWRKWNCDFISFQTGTYHVGSNNTTKIFQEGADLYPKRLWTLILKRLKG